MVFTSKNSYRKWFFCSTGAVSVIFVAALGANFARGVFDTSRSPMHTDLTYYQTVVEGQKIIALTFDDGPDPQKTGEIMSILKKYDVPATFFFLGSSALRYPEVAREAYEAGFEIGNHTFTHSWGVHSSEARIGFELSITNEILKGITGTDTLLYRPPFLLDIGSDATEDPNTPEEAQRWIAERGYVVVGADIDSRDWLARSPQEVADRVLADAPNGHIVLLHDGGQGRYTPAALDIFIPALLAQGYRFVSASEVLGLGAPGAPVIAGGRDISFVTVTSGLGKFFFVATKILLGLVVVRLLFILGLFLRRRFFAGTAESRPAYWRKSVAVVIPIHNEEHNIRATIESILASTHPVEDIVVVDDGSTDGSRAVVREYVRRYPARVRLIEKTNGGKASALMSGVFATKSEAVVTVDGDTILERETIGWLLCHLSNPAVGAVAGRVAVVPAPSLLNRFQHIEYTVNQELEKSLLADFNAVGVVPGPVGAWRRTDLLRAGGYRSDTLVEDQDTTLAMLALGKVVCYEPKALAYTEPPHTLRDFLAQRLRWTFGTLQCLWKYRRHFGSVRTPGLGLIVLPNSFIFGICMGLFYPLIDLFFLLSFPLGFSPLGITLFVVFTIVDMGYAALGLVGEPARARLLLLLPIQRLFYRFAIYYVVLGSVGRALMGSGLLWGTVMKRGEACTHQFALEKIKLEGFALSAQHPRM